MSGFLGLVPHSAQENGSLPWECSDRDEIVFLLKHFPSLGLLFVELHMGIEAFFLHEAFAALEAQKGLLAGVDSLVSDKF